MARRSSNFKASAWPRFTGPRTDVGIAEVGKRRYFFEIRDKLGVMLEVEVGRVAGFRQFIQQFLSSSFILFWELPKTGPSSPADSNCSRLNLQEAIFPKLELMVCPLNGNLHFPDSLLYLQGRHKSPAYFHPLVPVVLPFRQRRQPWNPCLREIGRQVFLGPEDRPLARRYPPSCVPSENPSIMHWRLPLLFKCSR